MDNWSVPSREETRYGRETDVGLARRQLHARRGHHDDRGSGQLTIPSPCYLIEHDRGLLLFDTGLTPEAVGDPRRVFGELAEEVGIKFTEEQRVDCQIEALGYRTDQVTHVVASHVHLDHSGGLRLFPDAKFFAGAGELPYAFWPAPVRGRPSRVKDRSAVA
jgi:glyoxylase-like metal-dependent hydrolase (beta-lactamase superfamily II)